MSLANKWQTFLEDKDLPPIATATRQGIIAQILENQEKDLVNEGHLTEAEVQGDYTGGAAGVAAGTTTGGIVGVAPTVMGLVRRIMPQLMAFDTVGVQPLNGPSGQVFYLRSVYGSDPRAANFVEAFAPGKAPQTGWSGSLGGTGIGALQIPNAVVWSTGASIQPNDFIKFTGAGGSTEFNQYVGPAAHTVTADAAADFEELVTSNQLIPVGQGLLTSIAETMENFNGTSGNPYAEMSFRIDKQTVTAKSRQLKAQYSLELAQDLRAVHGLDADSELSNILASEILVEINRETVNTILTQAQTGAAGLTAGTTTAGVFDLSDANDVKNARWAGEAYKALLIQIEKEANEIGRQTGRGNGNFIIASRNVVSALSMTDVLISMGAQGLQQGLNTDTNSSVFAGILGGRFRVYIDQYAQFDYFVVGYKGANEMDAGVYYSPYVPLTTLRGQNPANMQPVMAMKTRYAMSVNPFALPQDQQIVDGSPLRTIGKNPYYRRVAVKGL
ncbi:major capsid protein [Pseudomonas phage Astolliot]|nr:major capsid protein [Pseudomonas phage Astolliot]